MVQNDKKESMEERLQNETGFPKCIVKDIFIINNVKKIDATCETESGIKKKYTFLLDDNKIYIGQRNDKKE